MVSNDQFFTTLPFIHTPFLSGFWKICPYHPSPSFIRYSTEFWKVEKNELPACWVGCFCPVGFSQIETSFAWPHVPSYPLTLFKLIMFSCAGHIVVSNYDLEQSLLIVKFTYLKSFMIIFPDFLSDAWFLLSSLLDFWYSLFPLGDSLALLFSGCRSKSVSPSVSPSVSS